MLAGLLVPASPKIGHNSPMEKLKSGTYWRQDHASRTPHMNSERKTSTPFEVEKASNSLGIEKWTINFYLLAVNRNERIKKLKDTVLTRSEYQGGQEGTQLVLRL